MTDDQLIEKIALDAQITRAQAHDALNRIRDYMFDFMRGFSANVTQRWLFSLPTFGTFTFNFRAGSTKFDVRTRTYKLHPAMYRVAFRAGAKLDRIANPPPPPPP